LINAQQVIETARRGLEDMKAGPGRRLSGLHNVVVFGRAVTNVLQNLRSTEPDFDPWYQSVRDEMKADPLMKFFYSLRSRILKEGDTGVRRYFNFNFNYPEDMERFGPPPKNARDFFIDANGRAGWNVEIGVGLTEKYYVELPAEIGEMRLYFYDAPGVTEQTPVRDIDVVSLSERYLDSIDRILSLAETRFGRHSKSD
jgi:hypothetical protein